MKRKILLPLLFVFMSILVHGQITLTTTSTSDAWSPEAVTNTGNVLTWTAAPNGVFLGQIVNANDPTFDFSTNVNNDPITITITNTDNDFSGLTHLIIRGEVFNVDDVLTDIDISQATALEVLNLNYNELSTIDISQNIELTEFIIRGNRQLLNQNLNTTANTKLEVINIEGSGINNLDLSSNNLLANIDLRNARLTTSVLDKVVMDLDANGENGGNLSIDSNVGQLSYNSYTSYNTLTTAPRNWTIDVSVPPSGANTETITLTTTSSIEDWALGRFTNNGLDFTWTTSSNADYIGETKSGNNPGFDFSGNINNLDIIITITSEDGFDYLLDMSLYLTGGRYSDITDIEISNANDLKYLYPYRSNLNSIDVSQNTGLQRLLIHNNTGNNKQLVNQLNDILDISANTELYQLAVENTYIQSLSSLLTNPLLRDVNLKDSEFTSAALDQVLFELDANGITNPPDAQDNEHIEISGNPGSLTSASFTAYNNLIIKGWTIDVASPPAAPGPDINVTGLGVSIPGNNTPSTTNDTDFGSVASGGVISKTFTIENLGDEPLDLIGSPDLVSVSGANASEFTISVVPTTPIAVNGNTTFEVTFNANSLGIRIANLTIESNDPDEASYIFNIQAEATVASGAEINVTGNSISIPNGNTPIIADGTDFGQVAVDSPITHTFTIENLGDSDLTINYFFTGGTYYTSNPSGGGGIVISSGSSTTIDVIFGPLSSGIQAGTLTIGNTDSDEGLYVLNFTAEGIPAGSSGEIDVQGNGISITNGSLVPSVANDTDFGQIENNLTKTATYTIINNGIDDLSISDIGFTFASAVEFSIATPPSYPQIILPGANLTFDVLFAPTSEGIYNAGIQIVNSDTDQNPFEYALTGEGVANVVSGDIMISQYYSGFSGNDDWIEVKNISSSTIPANTYYVVRFDQSQAREGVVESATPIASFLIDAAMAPGDVWLLENSLATLPLDGNIGQSATRETTNVCDFEPNGDDMFLISTSNGANSYNLREDIIGNLGSNASTAPSPWGRDVSYIKGGCSSEIPHLNFDLSDWTTISPLSDVDNAFADRNIALGTQFVGATEYNGSSWSNGEADRSRSVIITNDLTGAAQSIEACDLTINNGVDVLFDSNGNTSNSIEIYGDLVVEGSLIIGDTESLVTLKATASLDEITKIEKSNPMPDQYQSTYWSSPVLGAQISTVFAGVDQDRIFEYRPGADNPNVNYGHWFIATGSMGIGYGYASPRASTDIQTLTFSGVPNNGNIIMNLYFKGSADTGDENDNFNLIGNPYPTAINIQDFLIFNPSVNQIALWTQGEADADGNYNSADYVYYNQSGSSIPLNSVDKNIGSGQGFMARTMDFSGVAFSNVFKLVDQNNQFFKSSSSKSMISGAEKSEKNRIWLELRNANNVKSNILIGFFDKATDEVDKFYDDYGLKTDKGISLYSRIPDSNSKYLIQGLSSFDNSKSVTLGFDSEFKSDMRLSIADIEGYDLSQSEVYIVDRTLNLRHDLKKSAYEFTSDIIGEFPDRFKLEFVDKNIDIEEMVDQDKFSIINDFDIMNIESGKSVDEIKVYDLLGRMIIQKLPNQKSFQLNTSSVRIGTLMLIEARMEDGSLINTKSIKY